MPYQLGVERGQNLYFWCWNAQETAISFRLLSRRNQKSKAHFELVNGVGGYQDATWAGEPAVFSREQGGSADVGV